MSGPGSRRAFLRGAGVTFAGGAPLLLGACGNGPAVPPGMGDVDVLNSVLDLEYATVTLYRQGAPVSRGSARAAATQFLAQEQAHAAALAREIRRLGGTPNRPKATYPFPKFTDQTGFLTFANTIERSVVAEYIDAIPRISDVDVRATLAAIVTTEAEHISILLRGLGEDQVPKAFVTGLDS